MLPASRWGLDVARCENGLVEGGGGILAGDLGQDDVAAGMCVDEVCEVVDTVVNNAPEAFFRIVLCDFFARDLLVFCELERHD